GSSLVEIDLLDEQPVGTLLRLTHTGLPNAQCAGHAESWAHYLDRLVEVAARTRPRPGLVAWPYGIVVLTLLVELDTGSHTDVVGNVVRPDCIDWRFGIGRAGALVIGSSSSPPL